jgi:hypothetical protein
MRRHFVLFVAGVLAGALAAPAAGDQGKGKGKGKGHKDGGASVVFVDTDRGAVRTYWVDTYGRGNCPPGLAKKGNGCLPPGQAKKRYVIGQPLPRTIVVERVPVVLMPRLSVVPAGYEYVVVDGDVLLMNVASRVIADAIVNLFD